jgi:ferritin
MITEKLQKAISEQLTAELWSANLYLSMSLYLQRVGYAGMAHWMQKQWEEENGHAYKLASYVVKRGGRIVVDKVDVVPNDFGTPLEVFQQVYEHECRVSAMIDKLVDVAIAEKDKATQAFLWEFVTEQTEEEEIAQGIVDRLKLAGTAGLLSIDNRLGQR